MLLEKELHRLGLSGNIIKMNNKGKLWDYLVNQKSLF